VFRATPHSATTLHSHLRDRLPDVDDLETSMLVYDTIRKLDSVECLELQPCPRDTRDIICNYANVDRIPDELEMFLRRKTRGNPLYISDAIQLFIDCNLIARRTSPDPELFFPTAEFERLDNIHALPIPLSVEAIVGSQIDKMSLVQVLIIKVAAIIGEVFTLGLIKTLFPLKSKEDLIDNEFKELRDSGFVVVVRSDRDMYIKHPNPDDIQHGFESGYMVEILRKRMLNKQKLKLNTQKKKVERLQQQELRNQFIKKAFDTLDVAYEGFLQVRKENARNITKPWKPRYVVLAGNELVQYYEKDNPKRLEVIILNEHSSVRTEPIGLFAHDPAQNPSTALYCFTISTSRWEKKSRLRLDAREFTLGCVKEEDRVQWVYRVQYQIDVLKLQKEAQDPNGDPRSSESSAMRGALDAGAIEHAGDQVTPVVAGSPASRGGLHNGSRPSISTVASDTSSTSTTKKGLLKAVFSKRRRSALRERAKETQYGVEIDHMLPEDFKAIRQPENLQALWAPGSSRADRAVVQNIPQHTIDTYYEAAEMSLVSRNSEGEIDGYLLGKLQSQRRTHVIGLITACAVIPRARRKGIGRRLYHKFFALCRAKGCRFVRVIIPRENSVTIAFHRSLGFEEDDYSTELLARADGGDRCCFVKDLDLSLQEKVDDFVEILNPLHHNAT